jgi:hypothetical protein
MEGDGFLSDRNIGLRTSTIIENAYDWLQALDLSPDPRYPAIGITRIDEIYGKGEGPRGLWFDWIDGQRDLIGPDTATHHNWMGSGVVCIPGRKYIVLL